MWAKHYWIPHLPITWYSFSLSLARALSYTLSYVHMQSFAGINDKNFVWPHMSVTWLVAAYECRSVLDRCPHWVLTSCCDFDQGVCEDPLWGRAKTACQLHLLPLKIHSAPTNRETVTSTSHPAGPILPVASCQNEGLSLVLQIMQDKLHFLLLDNTICWR